MFCITAATRRKAPYCALVHPAPAYRQNIVNALNNGLCCRFNLSCTAGQRFKRILPIDTPTEYACCGHYWFSADDRLPRWWFYCGEFGAQLLLPPLPQPAYRSGPCLSVSSALSFTVCACRAAAERLRLSAPSFSAGRCGLAEQAALFPVQRGYPVWLKMVSFNAELSTGAM